jgi:hypothetical protein
LAANDGDTIAASADADGNPVTGLVKLLRHRAQPTTNHSTHLQHAAGLTSQFPPPSARAVRRRRRR